MPILVDPDMGRLADDPAWIKGCEFHRHAPNKVPDGAAAGEKIRHGKPSDVGRPVGQCRATRRLQPIGSIVNALHSLVKPGNGLERVKGIEPSSSAWKAVALPLSYTRAGRGKHSEERRGGGGRTRTYEGIASGFTVRPLCRSGHSPSHVGRAATASTTGLPAAGNDALERAVTVWRALWWGAPALSTPLRRLRVLRWKTRCGPRAPAILSAAKRLSFRGRIARPACGKLQSAARHDRSAA